MWRGPGRRWTYGGSLKGSSTTTSSVSKYDRSRPSFPFFQPVLLFKSIVPLTRSCGITMATRKECLNAYAYGCNKQQPLEKRKLALFICQSPWQQRICHYGIGINSNLTEKSRFPWRHKASTIGRVIDWWANTTKAPQLNNNNNIRPKWLGSGRRHKSGRSGNPLRFRLSPSARGESRGSFNTEKLSAS